MSLFNRIANRRSRRGEGETDSASVPPNVAADAVRCHFTGLTRSSKSVIVDMSARQLHFENCHTPRKFWAIFPQPRFRCGLDDVVALHRHDRKSHLRIVTTTGNADILCNAIGFQELCDCLANYGHVYQPGFATDHPQMAYACIGGGSAGVLLGGFLTPQNAPNSILPWYMVVGGIAGVAATYSAVRFADRVHRVSLAQPLGFGFLTAVAAMTLDKGLQQLFGFNMARLPALVAIGFFVGMAVGFVKQSRSSANPASPESVKMEPRD